MTGQSLSLVTRAEAAAHGLARYFTGKQCKYGHISERDTNAGSCVECKHIYNLALYKSNPDEARARTRAWRAANLEKARALDRSRYAEDPENKLKRCRVWRAANLEKKRTSVREWMAANPQSVAAHQRNRRARKRAAEGFHTADDIMVIRKAQRDKCANPACRINLKGAGHVDHIQPLARGGSNWPRNLQLLCQPCNQSKHARDPIAFMQAQGMLL